MQIETTMFGGHKDSFVRLNGLRVELSATEGNVLVTMPSGKCTTTTREEIERAMRQDDAAMAAVYSDIDDAVRMLSDEPTKAEAAAEKAKRDSIRTAKEKMEGVIRLTPISHTGGNTWEVEITDCHGGNIRHGLPSRFGGMDRDEGMSHPRLHLAHQEAMQIASRVSGLVEIVGVDVTDADVETAQTVASIRSVFARR